MSSAPVTITRPAAEPTSRADLFARLDPYTKGSVFQGTKSFLIDVAIYAAGIASVLVFDNIFAKILGGLIAGMALVNLGSLAHEAAHGALVPSKRANKVMGVISMTMVLFNYRLWIYDHHVLHHASTNVKGHNSFSPLTPEEYGELSPWRKALYRIYRNGRLDGIFLYYLLERWPGVHLYPGDWLPRRFHASAWRYTAMQAAYGIGLIALLAGASLATQGSVVAALLCGFVIPYTVWLTTFSMTVGLQHTHPRLPWYRDKRQMAAVPADLSVQLLVPGWFNYLTHYALEHPVHHVTARVPHYHLKNAQAALGELAETPVIGMPFTLGAMHKVFKACKLFDYERQVWLDFDGKVTATPDEGLRSLARSGAEALPYGGDPQSPSIFFPEGQSTKSAEKSDEVEMVNAAPGDDA